VFDEPLRLLLGLVSGMIFGFLLQKGRVAKFEVIVGQLLLRDWTVAKIMLTAVTVGAIGIYSMLGLGWVNLHLKPMQFGGIITGGVLFGVGMAILGYCPGTSVAACGEGRRDAMAGVLGMLVGAGLYVGLYPILRPLIQVGNYGELTLQEATGIPEWVWIAALILGVGILWAVIGRFFEKTTAKPPGSASSA
jgi:uncharacterized protein